MSSTSKDLKIVQLSDLHIGENISSSTKCTLKIFNELQPYIILLTGDYVKWKGNKQVYDNTISFLSQLSAPLGIGARYDQASGLNAIQRTLTDDPTLSWKCKTLFSLSDKHPT